MGGVRLIRVKFDYLLWSLNNKTIMKNKNIKKQKKAKNSLKSRSKQNLPEGYSYISYNITWEPIINKDFPEEVAKQKQELHDLLYSAPKKAIPRLIELKEKYPDIPELYNWLNGAYTNAGDTESSEAITKESYEKNPDYLFAQLNYAEMCLKKGNLDEIPIIFDNKLELSLLYPERDTFHISEVVGFYGLMSIYYSDKGYIHAALTCYKLLDELAPNHQTTQRVNHHLQIATLREMLKLSS